MSEWAGPKLATVVKHPSSRTPKAPRTLRAAIGPGGTERDVLVVLRWKLAALVDSDPPAYQLVNVIRQLREVDAEIRALDACEAERAKAEDGDPGDDDEDPDDESFDPNSL